MSPIELPEDGNMTEDIFCMLKAIHTMIVKIVGDEDMDLLDTIAMLNRLVFQFGEKKDEAEN